MFQIIEQARKNNNDPIALFKEVTNNYKPDQLNNLFEKAKQMGVPDEYINQVKEGINAK